MEVRDCLDYNMLQSVGHIRAATTSFTVPYGASDLPAQATTRQSACTAEQSFSLEIGGLADGRELFGLGLQPRDDRFREPVLHTLATTATHPC